jgi:4-diphosphocytidyl-2-C-methyl-D-erythritol kinase
MALSQPEKITLKAPAKVNLFLEVKGKRPDGYWEIETVMQTVTLYDTLVLQKATDLEVVVKGAQIPQKENLVFKAAEMLREESALGRGAKIELQKNIPVGRGLGGGSSDAAATLVGLNRLWGLGLSRENLASMAEDLGADVPFFLYGGTCLCTGRGDRIEPVASKKVLHYVLISPHFGIPTKKIYKNLRIILTKEARETKILVEALSSGQVAKVAKFCYNALENIAFDLYPELDELKRKLKEVPFLYSGMTGSGSCFFGLCQDELEARQLVKKLEGQNLGTIFSAKTHPGTANGERSRQ